MALYTVARRTVLVACTIDYIYNLCLHSKVCLACICSLVEVPPLPVLIQLAIVS